MRTSFIVEARSDRARSDAEPRSTCYRKRDGAFFDLRRREFIPLLCAAAVYPSPANIREKIDDAHSGRTCARRRLVARPRARGGSARLLLRLRCFGCVSLASVSSRKKSPPRLRLVLI